MKILFLFFTDPPRAFSSSVAALSAVVREAGYDPVALEVARKSEIAPVAEKIDAWGPDLVCVSSMSRDWPGAAALLSRLRCHSYVIVGGYHASLARRDVAACPAVDAICIGEGERPLVWLIQQLDGHAAQDAKLSGDRPQLQTQPGLWIRQAGGWSDPIPQADPEPDIAKLPAWDYEVFGDVHQALADSINTFGPHDDGYLPTRAGRGCPFTCAYCSAPKWGKLHDLGARAKRNIRPVAHLCDELASLRDRYQPEGFEFWDEHFPIKLEWLREFAREYPRRVGLRFKVEMHPSAASRERLSLLAEAGCSLFHCGIESGDEALRKNVLNRRTSDAKLQEVFDTCRELGLETSASLMTMLPGETRAQAHSTLQLLHRLQPGSFMWSNYQALPGTALGEAAVEHWPGPARERFDDYDQIQSLTPPQVSKAERTDTFRELAQLQGQLVQIATKRSGRDTSRARRVDIPVSKRRAPVRFAELVGLAPPDAPLSSARVNAVSFAKGVLTLEIEHPDFDVTEVRLAPLDGKRHYIELAQLGLSYRGREAPQELLNTLQTMAEHLGNIGIKELCETLVKGQ